MVSFLVKGHIHPTFSVVGYHQEVFSIHYKGLPVPGTMGGNPLVEGELQLSGAPLVDDRELLTPFIWPKVGHSQEDLEEKHYLVLAPDQEPSLQDSDPQHLSHMHREGYGDKLSKHKVLVMGHAQGPMLHDCVTLPGTESMGFSYVRCVCIDHIQMRACIPSGTKCFLSLVFYFPILLEY